MLLTAGMAITFSATLHEQLGFDLTIVAGSLAAIGVAHLVEAGAVSRPVRGIPALLAAVAIVAAILVPFSDSPIKFAVVVAAWSLTSALLEFIGGTIRPGSRSDTVLLGATGILLALLVLLTREDQVAILGFFGAYAIVAGVFLGISAFDTKRAASTHPHH